MWRPREGQFCRVGCRDAERWTVVGIIPIQDPRLTPKPTLPLIYSYD